MSTSEHLKTMLTVAELAERWRVKPRTIYAMIAEKKIVVLRVGRLVRISRSHVEFLENRPQPE
jgi:excisionase family DNA binding protein